MLHKKKPLWLIFVIDILLTAAALGIFSLYYIVLPKEGEAQFVIEDTSDQNTDEESSQDDNVKKERGRGRPGDNSTSTAQEESLDSANTETVSTDDSYQSDQISISIEKYEKSSGDSKITYYVADIYVDDITSFQTAFADDTYGRGYSDTILDMDEENNAILAINGDYYGNSNEGIVIRNGVVYRTESTDADVCVLYYDGTMETMAGSEFDIDAEAEKGAYQAWTFGPALLNDDGTAITDFSGISKRMENKNPRSAIGYYEPGHYCLVLVDGRSKGYSCGMTMEELSELFEELGCSTAYNLDGGKSSVMTFQDEIVNQPYEGGRESSDCILIKEAE